MLKDVKLDSLSISKKDTRLLWQDVDQVYHKWEKLSINFIPAEEKRRIVIKSKQGETMKLGYCGLFRLGKKKHEEIAALYQEIINHVFDRQWDEFANKLKANREVSFVHVKVGPDYLKYKSLFKEKILKLDSVQDYATKDAFLRITYLDGGKLKTSFISRTADIPNFYILSHFLGNIIAANKSQK